MRKELGEQKMRRSSGRGDMYIHADDPFYTFSGILTKEELYGLAA